MECLNGTPFQESSGIFECHEESGEPCMKARPRYNVLAEPEKSTYNYR